MPNDITQEGNESILGLYSSHLNRFDALNIVSHTEFLLSLIARIHSLEMTAPVKCGAHAQKIIQKNCGPQERNFNN